MTSSRILIVEDEPSVQMIVADLLRAEQYEVAIAKDGKEGWEQASGRAFELLILDVMLPGMDGFALCENLRQQGYDGAILMLTARGQVDVRVLGLRTGADDYLSKPFDSNELLARVSALLRRTRKGSFTPVNRFQFADVSVDLVRDEATRAGERLSLAAKEIQLLKFLIQHRGEVVSRDTLLAEIWKQQPFITPRTVDVHIAWLRQKLEVDSQNPQFILTVRGEGYRFRG